MYDSMPLMLELDSPCGCGFRLEQDEERNVTIEVHSGNTQVTRRFADVDPQVLSDFVEFAWSVALAVEEDAKCGDIRNCFVDPRFASDELGIEMTFDLIDDKNDALRGRLAFLHEDSIDTLNYCHLGVTVDLSLEDLLQRTEKAMSTHPMT